MNRIQTIQVNIGNVPVGNKNPIRIQSMTNTDTMDTQATVAQALRMVDAGCEYVRITAPAIKHVENLANIKKELCVKGCDVPLIADIHFLPKAAELAARIVEKVRINPGNYADKKSFKTIEYTDDLYKQELERIYEKFSPLVKICKQEGTALRIGVNHGSLSDRIMSRYGDTPLGMVESALEFLDICEQHSFDQVVVSMKASNVCVMVEANRLLVQRMQARGKVYPIHVGVTEAGEGEDGRIKSAVGISALLVDGIGDTIRVSLTEDPEFEMPVATKIVESRESRVQSPKARLTTHDSRLTTNCVIADFNKIKNTELWTINPDYFYLGNQRQFQDLPEHSKIIYDYAIWNALNPDEKIKTYPYFSCLKEWIQAGEKHQTLNFLNLDLDDVKKQDKDFGLDEKVVLILESDHRNSILDLMDLGITCPVIIKESISQATNDEEYQLAIACQFGVLMIDKLINGFWVAGNDLHVKTAFGLLQAARLRMTKTEFISCPSCGRTLFDLQKTTAKIRDRLGYKRKIKIAIMGCIVNGPGEMADADYGYVGAGPGKITLYRGKEVVEKNIDEKDAVDRLEAIIGDVV